MSKLMLIDAVHPEETRVALTENGRVDDFDFETAGKEQLRGNIYLAKVTRVEPSLQACFIEYGGNRHGFLAFNEIHPDYYQLPQADREALLAETALAAAEAEDEGLDIDDDEDGGARSELDVIDDEDEDGDDSESTASSDGDEDGSGHKPKRESRSENSRPRRTSPSRRYKIQEVIRRRQVMLVQVVKEERGNKGAALTTFLSLAGRYSVLMPNTPRGGGISRKISSSSDRKRLKEIMSGLNVPNGMGLIVRTAGAKRTKTEIRRDYDYLQKLWDKIRDRTMNSMAPCLIHEEGGLVHRAMRDMFDKAIEEVLIQGEAAYREAKDLAKLIMPTQSKKVKHWKSPEPLFVAENIESQLDSIFSPTVQMKSGGYLVINQTEALVAIDVNSGKATRERNIEQTALRTNLEAAEEACRQMRLRDLAGLVVIDFIDMEENKNNRAVENKLKDCLKLDRARVQTGRISQFGLMEISRQRRRAGVLQATSDPCEACDGTGRRRSIPSAALQLLRAIEARASAGNLLSITVEAPTEIALYLLNNKRDALSAIEDEAGFAIAIRSSESMLPGDFKIDAERDPNAKSKPQKTRRADAIESEPEDEAVLEDDEDEDDSDEAEASADEPSKASDSESDEDRDSSGRSSSSSSSKRRRRGRRGGRRRKRASETAAAESLPQDGGAFLDGLAASPVAMLASEEDAAALQPLIKIATAPSEEAADSQESGEPGSDGEDTATPDTSQAETGGTTKPKSRRRRRGGRKPDAAAPAEDTGEVSETTDPAPEGEPAEIAAQTADADVTLETPEQAPESAPPAEAEANEPAAADPVEAGSETPVAALDAETPAEATEIEPEAAPEPDPEPETAATPDSETSPVFEEGAQLATEPVIVSSDGEPVEEDTKPKRRGWWSRGR